MVQKSDTSPQTGDNVPTDMSSFLKNAAFQYKYTQNNRQQRSCQEKVLNVVVKS